MKDNHLEEEKIKQMLTEMKIITEDDFNVNFFKDLDTMFWRRVWIKWNLENPSKGYIDKKYEKAIKNEPLITKDDLKREFLELLRHKLTMVMFADRIDTGLKDLSYIG